MSNTNTTDLNGGKSGECSGWHWYGATSPEWERASWNLGSSLRKRGGETVTEPCSALHSGGVTIMLLLKRNEKEHHSTSSPAIPSPRSQLKLNHMGKPPHLHSHAGSGAASPSQCIFRVDAVQMFANHPKAKKIFLLLISCSLRRFYFV